jgi:protein disulfide-isomerase
MKFLSRTLVLLLITAASSLAATPPWTDDWEAAKAKSKFENKPILIYMTGSDWCGWCKKLEKEVISKKAFTDFAAEHFILMEADFPKTKEQPAPLKKQNAALRKTYLNGGYPTMYVLDAEGKKLSKDLGEIEGGLDGYVAKLKEFLPKDKAAK